MAKPSTFHAKVREMRHDAIVDVAVGLLAERGYEAMTMEETARRAEISRVGLYRHFGSKEALAAATMRRLLRLAIEQVERIERIERIEGIERSGPVGGARAPTAIERLAALVRWAVELQLAGRMPTLPTQDSALTDVLRGDGEYMALLERVGEALTAWIDQAQRDGAIDPTLPASVVLMAVFARACDPVPAMLARFGHRPDEIVGWSVAMFERALRAPPRPADPPAPSPGRRRGVPAPEPEPAQRRRRGA